MNKENTACQKEENEKNCPCASAGCKNHGVCCRCVAYHRARGGMPACLRK